MLGDDRHDSIICSLGIKCLGTQPLRQEGADLRKTHAIAIVAAAFGLTEGARADPLSILEPSGPWRLDYAEDSCRLTRTFGLEKDTVILGIERGGNPYGFDGFIAGPSLPKRSGLTQLSMRVDPQEKETVVTGEFVPASDVLGMMVRWFDADNAFFNEDPSDQFLHVATKKGFAKRLRLESLGKARGALDTCYAELLKSWGLDKPDIDTLLSQTKRSRPAYHGNPGTVTAQRADRPETNVPSNAWVSWLDYPSEALRQEAAGSATMVLSLDPVGKVVGCRVVKSSKVESLDKRSCEVLTARANYTPAVNSLGEAAPSTTVERIRWVMPSD